MKTGQNNEIVSATIEELEAQWKKGEWDSIYSFKEYLKIQTEQNGIQIKEGNK